ncbi:RDD family protein, partial [Halobacillus trueperi]
RNLLRIIDMLPFYYLIGMLMVFFHPQHKRLGDLVGGTI